MARNHNKTPNTDKKTPYEVMQEAQVDGTFNGEKLDDTPDVNPDENVGEQGARISFAEIGADFVEPAKDKLIEMGEKAREKLRVFGKAAGKFAKEAGLTVIGAGVIGVGAGIAAAGRARQNMRDRKANRQAMIAKRLEQAEKQRQDEALLADWEAARQEHMDELHGEALEENERKDKEFYQRAESYARDMYGSRGVSWEDAVADYKPRNNAELEGLRAGYESSLKELVDADHAEALGMNEKFDEEQRMNAMHEEALEENERFDAEKRAAYEARVAARYARYAAYQRREARRQKYENFKTRVADSRVGKIGRAIGKFVKRATGAVTEGARAAKASWQEAAPQEETASQETAA